MIANLLRFTATTFRIACSCQIIQTVVHQYRREPFPHVYLLPLRMVFKSMPVYLLTLDLQIKQLREAFLILKLLWVPVATTNKSTSQSRVYAKKPHQSARSVCSTKFTLALFQAYCRYKANWALHCISSPYNAVERQFLSSKLIRMRTYVAENA